MTASKRYPCVLFGNLFDFGFISDRSDEVEYEGLTPLKDIPGIICTKTRKAREEGRRLVPVLIHDSKAFTFSAVAKAEAVVLERLIAEVA